MTNENYLTQEDLSKFHNLCFKLYEARKSGLLCTKKIEENLISFYNEMSSKPVEWNIEINFKTDKELYGKLVGINFDSINKDISRRLN